MLYSVESDVVLELVFDLVALDLCRIRKWKTSALILESATQSVNILNKSDMIFQLSSSKILRIDVKRALLS